MSGDDEQEVGSAMVTICWLVMTSARSPDLTSHLESLSSYGPEPRVVRSIGPSLFDEAADFGTDDL